MKKLYPILIVTLLSIHPVVLKAQWPKPPNTYSWEGTWNPTFPIPNMYDDYYFDAHQQSGQATPVLPPGVWDWQQEHNLSNWNLFKTSFGHFAAIVDNQNRIFGWKLITNMLPSELTAGAAYFKGSPGIDILDLGAGSSIHSTGEIALGDGPDIIRFEKGYSLYLTTGSGLTGAQQDNDLVIAGRNMVPADGSVDIKQTSIVTGPGNDLVFVNNMASAGVDAGCGAGGRTDTTDPNDGDDIVVYGGNMNDFRFVGGKGNDLAVWYADQVQQQVAGWSWLGPNFFGGGAWGKALWEDTGTDRLIMVIPPNTLVKNEYGAPAPGQLNVYLLNNYPAQAQADGPTETDVYARYCITCGIGPNQRKTITLEYVSADGKVFTGRFWLTAFEELQIGIGLGAKVYKLDDLNGKAVLDNSLKAITPPLRSNFNLVTNNFINSLKLVDPPTPGYAPTLTQIKGLEAYPNPTSDYVLIKYEGTQVTKCTLSLVDFTGQVVFKEDEKVAFGENTYQINMADFTRGVYMLVLTEDKKQYQAKVILY
ncbi:MAG: T9SS type A sorting domain-containing protein [Sphingobacteriaceae bacterium]